MRFRGGSVFIAYLLLQFCFVTRQQGSEKSIPIDIKDDGIVELQKGAVAMILYITVTNVAKDAVHLFVNSTKCCQKRAKEQQDCESMHPFGGDMGKLYPQDYRNLTLIYPNLYPHDREGSCDIEIKDGQSGLIKHKINFNTTLIRNFAKRIPRLLKNYYDFDDLEDCKGVDENPLNDCQHYECHIRYDGTRNYFNHTSKRCEKLPSCTPQADRDPSEMAYIVEMNSCKALVLNMTAGDFAQFKEGKPGVRTLAYAHGYPINVQCHNGKRDPKGRWCQCNKGWASAPFNHKEFNPDVQVYHMCTMWTGELSAEEARNITKVVEGTYSVANAVIFSLLGVGFFILLIILALVLYREKVLNAPTPSELEVIHIGETSGSDDTE